MLPQTVTTLTEQTVEIQKNDQQVDPRKEAIENAEQNGDKNKERSSLRLILSKLLIPIKFSNLRYRSWRTKASILLVIAAIVSGFATYAALTETPPFGNDPNIVIWLLNIDLILLLLLVALIAKRIVTIWSSRKRGMAGSHLHVRLVYIFSILAAVPTIIMTIFSAFFFHYGVQTWFSQRVQTAINESQAVAESYLEEHKQVIRADTLAMANDLDRQADILLTKPEAFEQVMNTQSLLRNLPEAVVMRRDGRIISSSNMTLLLGFERAPIYALLQADDGDVVLMTGEQQESVRALVRLNNFNDAYLFVGRSIDTQVISHLNATNAAVEDYAELQASYAGLQITVTMLFVVIGLMMLLAAIWFSLVLARQLVTPISELISTADRVRAGDLTARVPEAKTLEEFEFLAKSFNRMTQQIEQQRTELISANQQIDRRRRLTETVLKGVSSGVLGVDERGVINLANASAASLLNTEISKLTGEQVLNIFPELKDLLATAYKRPGKITSKEIQIHHGDKLRRTFLFKITIELFAEQEKGIILTFDDITELQSAQRKAAWSDVARRIAHEIKNPLTPIQLSAERLRRKYLPQIQENPETFETCTETIIKHVGDIGRMVDEFSSFARMPEPKIKDEIIAKILKESLVLLQQAHSNTVEFNIDIQNDVKDSIVELDSVQFRQAITNLAQNAIDSIESKLKDTGDKKGKIHIQISKHGVDEIYVAISDSGLGLPTHENPDNLTEPYITHKPKGTGLGLAIVKKIMEDHNGKLLMGKTEWLARKPNWQDLGGATVIMLLPLKNEHPKTKDREVA